VVDLNAAREFESRPDVVHAVLILDKTRTPEDLLGPTVHECAGARLAELPSASKADRCKRHRDG
jgi:hypothetical protein